MKRCLLVAILAASVSARADEGMWTYNNFPKDKVKAKYGFEPTDEWLDHVRLASVRFNNGGSASFVSPNLVMTNHHVGADCIHKLSTATKDFFAEGFYAKTADEEAKCPDLEINVLVGIDDVTSQVMAAKKPNLTQAQVNQAQKEIMSRIEKDCAQKTGQRCDVVQLYQGAVFNLYKYKKYTDVRLVFSPEFAIAFFGGDPDNFTFPRYDLDISFFRIYENGKPVSVEHYLSWSKNGAKDGDLVFVSGNPGSTGRLLTLAQLEFTRDVQYPFTLARLVDWQKMLQDFSARGPEQAREAKETLFSIENSLKAIRGYQTGLLDAKLMDAKAAQEKKMREDVAALEPTPEHKALAAAWDDIAKATESSRAYYKRQAMLEALPARESHMLWIARTILRLTEEKAKPSEKRLREYRDSALPSLDQQLYSPAPIYPDYEEAGLAFYLENLQTALGANDPVVKAVLGGKTPAEVAKAAIAGSKLRDPAVRKQAVKDGVAQSKDPLIAIAKALDPEARKLRKKYEDEVESVSKDAGGRIARAQFEATKGASYPDATFTLRLSYGQVRGYKENRKNVRWATDFKGLYQHATGTDPLKLPERWVTAKKKLKLSVPFDFVSTNDIIGGNSGSPVFNKGGELVGIIFDGNIESLPNRFVYTEEQARSVSVASQGILEALKSVYGATELVNELQAAATRHAAAPLPSRAGQP